MCNIFCHFYFLSKMCNLGIFSSSKLKRAKVLQVREDTPKSYLFSSRKTKVTDGGKNKTSAYTVPVKLGMAWPLMNGFAHNQASDKKTEPLCEVSVAGHISRKPKSRQSNIKTDKSFFFFFFWQREFIIGVFFHTAKQQLPTGLVSDLEMFNCAQGTQSLS